MLVIKGAAFAGAQLDLETAEYASSDQLRTALYLSSLRSHSAPDFEFVHSEASCEPVKGKKRAFDCEAKTLVQEYGDTVGYVSPKHRVKVIDANLTKKGDLVFKVDFGNRLIQKIPMSKDEVREIVNSKLNDGKAVEVVEENPSAKSQSADFSKGAAKVKKDSVKMEAVANVGSGQEYQNSNYEPGVSDAPDRFDTRPLSGLDKLRNLIWGDR
jgi:hypothetical protein